MPRSTPPDTATLEPRRFAVVLAAPTVDLAAAELRAAADRHRRVAVSLSGELEADRVATGKDIRTGALQVIRVLAEADSLIRAAEQLEDGYSAGALYQLTVVVDGQDLEDELENGDEELDPALDPDVAEAKRLLGLVPTVPAEPAQGGE